VVARTATRRWLRSTVSMPSPMLSLRTREGSAYAATSSEAATSPVERDSSLVAVSCVNGPAITLRASGVTASAR